MWDTLYAICVQYITWYICNTNVLYVTCMRYCMLHVLVCHIFYTNVSVWFSLRVKGCPFFSTSQALMVPGFHSPTLPKKNKITTKNHMHTLCRTLPDGRVLLQGPWRCWNSFVVVVGQEGPGSSTRRKLGMLPSLVGFAVFFCCCYFVMFCFVFVSSAQATVIWEEEPCWRRFHRKTHLGKLAGCFLS